MKQEDIIKQNFELRRENIALKGENAELKKLLKDTTNALSNANTKIKNLETKFEKYQQAEEERIKKVVEKAVNQTKKIYEKKIKELNNEIDSLNKEVTSLRKLLNTDSTNSSLPTSKNRIGKKIISNNREKTGFEKGGQKGHKQHKLDYFKDEEIDEVIEHTKNKCDFCGGKLKEISVVKSDIIDFDVYVKFKRNNIHNYKCSKCGKNISANNVLPRGVSYGDNVNATAITLINESNVALNKVRKHICGLTGGIINPTEGYFSKLQKNSADELTNFVCELKKKIVSLNKVHWDDTTITLSDATDKDGKKLKKGIMRFYGDDNWALLIGHENKSEDGINDDGILSNLDKNTVCIHDHVLLNYNDKYKFQNAECNEHILRYLKGVKDNIHDNTWQDEMRDLLKSLNDERNAIIQNEINSLPTERTLSFSDNKIKEVYQKYDEIIKKGYLENEKIPDYHFYKKDEFNLIKRLDEYRDNHLLFLKDFDIPFTNNTAERGLRQCKRKLAVSFMFSNLNTLKNYASILSYLETCYRHGISKFEAAKRLVSNNLFTIEELENCTKNEE